MRKILFPTDFSATALNAFNYCLHLAQSLEAEIYVLHNYEKPVISTLDSGMPENVMKIYDEIELQHFENFKAQTPTLRDMASEQNASEVPLTFLFKEGDLLDNIKRTITEEHIDWIVMGTSGASGFEKKWFGSNTIKTIKQVDIPILSIPHLAKFKNIDKIVFATRFSTSDIKPLGDVVKIAKHFDSQLTCLHVTPDPKDPTIELAMRDWDRTYDDFTLRYEIIPQSDTLLEDHITNFVREKGIDLIVLIKRNQGFFDKLFSSSLSQKLAARAKTPILIIKEEK